MKAFRLTVGEREITSLVMDEAEFAGLCDLLEQVRFSYLDPDKHRRMIEDIRHAQHLPLMARGAQTERVFEHYAVTTPYLSACVRGLARRMAAGTVTVDQAEAEPVFQAAFARLSRSTRKAIRQDSQELAKRLSKGANIEALLVELTRKYAPTADGQLAIHVQRSVEVTMAARMAQLGDPLFEIEGYFQRMLTGLAMLAQDADGA